MKEKGFIPIGALVAFLIAAAVGLTLAKDSSKTPAKPSSSPTVSTSPSVSPKASARTPDVKIVSASGEYQESGQTVSYNLSFPEQGGQISGSVEGICEGTPRGSFEGGEGGKIEGEIKGSCGLGFIRQEVDIKYTGVVHLKDKKIELNWEGNPPVGPKEGSFTLNIND